MQNFQRKRHWQFIQGRCTPLTGYVIPVLAVQVHLQIRGAFIGIFLRVRMKIYNIILLIPNSISGR